jgi:molybdopterin-dependent oxidoreductase alpha subunit
MDQKNALVRPDGTHSEYKNPAGGWGAVKRALGAHPKPYFPIKFISTLNNTNKPHGFDCPGCAWPDKGNTGFGPDSCEQGSKAVGWEMDRRTTAGADFFAGHTLAQLRDWSDHQLEKQGRLTEPMIYDSVSDRYAPIAWDDALSAIAATLRAMDPEKAGFYTSGRSSNEAAFLWQLLARSYGSANLPDSSNLCHEPSGFAMKAQIGMGKGTSQLEDFEHAELIMVIGQNPASNHPRQMVTLHEASKRGATVVSINPLTERGFVNFSDPKDLWEMATNTGRKVASKIYNVQIGGDHALMKGLMKRLVEWDDAGRDIIDRAFINAHTIGADDLLQDLRDESWTTIVAKSGLTFKEIDELAELYAKSKATIAMWCMGITHHEDSVATIESIVNLMLMRGNIGKPGAGVIPVRGHSNVQGDRTMGCTFKVPDRWLDNIEATFPGLKPSRAVGKDAIAVIEGLIDGSVEALLCLGGNFGRASPDSSRLLDAMGRSKLTVHIATKFNRSHCHPGEIGLLLPCLGRTDRDIHQGGDRFTTVEDSMSMVHATSGKLIPLSNSMLGEPEMVARLGATLLGARSAPWLEMAADYGLIRDYIELCVEGVFHGFQNFNERIKQPGGFWLTNWAAQRVWKTTSGKAEFRVAPISLDGPIERATGREGSKVLALMTIRSHGQYNTTVYSNDDSYRGIQGGRHVLLMNEEDMREQGFKPADFVDARTCSEDDIERVAYGFRLVAYKIPRGCIAGYMNETNPLAPIGLVSKGSRTPASKEIPIILAPARVPVAGGLSPEVVLPRRKEAA